MYLYLNYFAYRKRSKLQLHKMQINCKKHTCTLDEKRIETSNFPLFPRRNKINANLIKPRAAGNCGILRISLPRAQFSFVSDNRRESRAEFVPRFLITGNHLRGGAVRIPGFLIGLHHRLFHIEKRKRRHLRNFFFEQFDCPAQRFHYVILLAATIKLSPGVYGLRELARIRQACAHAAAAVQ